MTDEEKKYLESLGFLLCDKRESPAWVPMLKDPVFGTIFYDETGYLFGVQMPIFTWGYTGAFQQFAFVAEGSLAATYARVKMGILRMSRRPEEPSRYDLRLLKGFRRSRDGELELGDMIIRFDGGWRTEPITRVGALEEGFMFTSVSELLRAVRRRDRFNELEGEFRRLMKKYFHLHQEVRARIDMGWLQQTYAFNKVSAPGHVYLSVYLETMEAYISEEFPHGKSPVRCDMRTQEAWLYLQERICSGLELITS